MRVLLHAPQLAPWITGTDRLAHNLLAALLRAQAANEYQLEVHDGNVYVPEAVAGSGVRVRSYPRRRIYDPRSWPTRVRNTRERRAFDPDVFYSFHNLFAPAVLPCPVLVSVHDLVPLHQPELFHPSRPHRAVAVRRARRALHLARHVVTLSEYTHRQLVDDEQIAPDRITIVSPAADPLFQPVRDTALLDAVRERYQLPERFLFTLGSTDPRKNVRSVVAAYRLLPGELQADVGLVVAGAEWHGLDGDAWRDSERIRAVGAVPDEDLVALYSLADAFVFASVHEGFGMTPLEAMSCGAPVICSNATSLPEVVGDAALLVPPTDLEAIAGAMTELLGDAAARDRYAAAGFERARCYSWDRAAQVLLGTLERF
jgi:glycosyltransferase involved in cell wall biosynthesis